ncbi:hypothetical protein [Streptomyces longispororuber]|uniref:hypothetical protein n=1 Tax=Streptomyces longispororuber TaxID=68230 RepID=UPI0021087DC5|nr:hypothetical protein [Streptomyces longispororuber]MCQ4205558.1 hypothetical protein [Streptomyces longispororuber]
MPRLTHGSSDDGRSGQRGGGLLRSGVEFLGWWAALVALWIVLISGIDAWELGVGAACAFAGALAATAARRAAGAE